MHSVITQPRFPSCEIIIIDDGSTDHTGELCIEYCKQYGNIYVYSQGNAGVSSARNRGISLAKGQYLLFLDADDFYVPGSLNESLIPILEENFDLILFSSYKSNVDQNRYGVYMRCSDSVDTGHNVFPMPESFQAVMYRRELLLVLRSNLEGVIQFAGRLALRIPVIRRWRDKRVYPYTSVGVYGPNVVNFP